MSRNIKLQPALVAPARLKPPALMSDISELGPGLGAGLRGSETSEEKFMQTKEREKIFGIVEKLDFNYSYYKQLLH